MREIVNHGNKISRLVEASIYIKSAIRAIFQSCIDLKPADREIELCIYNFTFSVFHQILVILEM